jgi:hypothetical protein
MCPNNRRWYMLLPPWWLFKYQKQICCLSLGNRVYIGALENTHPQTDGFGKYVLFPVLRYIWMSA